MILNSCIGRVRLDVSRVNAFSLYPGQIVLVKGKNPSGYCLIADQIWSCHPPNKIMKAITENTTTTTTNNDSDNNINNNDKSDVEGLKMIKVMIAAGPFTYAFS